MTRALVHGAGRMARRVLAEVPEFETYEIVGLVSRSQPRDLEEFDWFPSLDHFAGQADLLIDFTLPGGTLMAAEWCACHDAALLSGTTGLTDEDIAALKSASSIVPVLWAPNLSPGVAIVSQLVRQAAGAMDSSVKVRINDVHHEHKVDAPSGTALALGSAVMDGRSEDREDNPDDDKGSLVYSSIREGEVIGEHTVSFELPGEQIEITHKALSRAVFAKGALKAGKWLVGQKPGYYSTTDWLGMS